MKGLTRTARLDRKGRARAVLRGHAGQGTRHDQARLRQDQRRQRIVHRPGLGRVKVTIKTTNKFRSLLRKHGSLKVKATVRIGVTSLSASLTIKPYKKPKR